MRVTRLDACGNPVYGACSTVVSDGFVSVASTADITTGDVIELKNANGVVCVRYKPPDTNNGYGVDVTFCRVDPDLYSLVTGNPQVIDTDTTEVVGFRVDTSVDTSTFGWALEIWSNVPSEACDLEGNVAYGYVLYPFLTGAIIGDYTIENNAVTFAATGGHTKSGGGWADGPYNVIVEGGLPAPLSTPMGASEHLHVQQTYLAPPVSTCGCTALADPDGSSGAPT
jgi:hypothetical protein